MTGKRILFSLLLFFPVILGGCAADKPRMRVLWPPLPERPRLEWAQSIRSEDDLRKPSQLSQALLGGGAEGAFKRPFGVVSDGKGKVYVSDPDNRSVKVVDLNARKIGLLSNAPAFRIPVGLALDGKGNLYIADAGGARVMVFGPQGEMRSSFGDSQIEKPAYIALREDLGRIYVSDGAGHKIGVFDMAGKFLFAIGSKGRGDGQFMSPQGMAFDRQGRLYVADQHNARIQILDADGKFLSKFGERGDKQWNFEGPKDLAFDSEGNLHVLDYRKSALVTYSPDGKLLLFTGGGGPSGSPVAFALPASIHIDAEDRIYIGDSFNMRLSVWQYLSEAYVREHPFDEETRKAQEELVRKKTGK